MNNPGRSGFKELAQEQSLYTQEAPARIKKSNRSLQIGVPRETSLKEKRVPLKPAAVDILVRNGHEVLVESKAGESANYSDNEYSDMGAKISYSSKEVFESQIVLKIEPPTLKEIGWMKTGHYLFSAFQFGRQTADYLEAINQRKIIALGYEFIEDKVGGLPLVRAMSEIAGSTAMIVAAEYLSSSSDGKGITIGGVTGVPPTRVAILGAGTVAEFAARAALGLGAEVRIFDNHIYKLRRLKHALGREIFTSTFDNTVLEKQVAETDVLIGAVRMDKGRNKILVTEEMVAGMKKGSVIIDISIDQGGCIETSEITTHDNPVFTKYDVIHYCVPNIASRAARTASQAISNIFTPILQEAGDEGGMEEMIYKQSRIMNGVYAYKGSLTKLELAKKFNMPYKDISLFMAARF